MTHYRILSPEEMISVAELSNLRVRYAKVLEAESKILQLHAHCSVTGKGACMSLTGETGTSKTSTIEGIKHHFPASDRQIPALHCVVPEESSVKNLLSRLLDALGDPLAKAETAN